MADPSPFTTGIEFLDKLGVYEILLPFLLIFTMVFAVLEKSRVFGTDTFNGEEVPKKNLNSMFAFVTAFMVVASSRLVAAINEAIANMTILLLLGTTFLLLAGVFHTGKKEFKVSERYQGILTIIMFVGILIIFLNALKTEDGTSYLLAGWAFVTGNLDSGAMGALILTILVVGFMLYVTGSFTLGGSSNDKHEEEH